MARGFHSLRITQEFDLSKFPFIEAQQRKLRLNDYISQQVYIFNFIGN